VLQCVQARMREDAVTRLFSTQPHEARTIARPPALSSGGTA
jgi:hypothetical protein